MKKCPSCYAIMRELVTPQAPEVSSIRVRYECSQCGHTEESFAKPAPVAKSGVIRKESALDCGGSLLAISYASLASACLFLRRSASPGFLRKLYRQGGLAALFPMENGKS
jgi:hypothetical protein